MPIDSTCAIMIVRNSCCLLFLYTFIVITTSAVNSKVFTNQFAIECRGESAAKEIAQRHGYTFIGQIGSLDNHFLFESPHVHKRSADQSDHHVNKLQSEPAILWVEQQHVKIRSKRDYVEKDELTLNDIQYKNYSKRSVRIAKKAPADFTDVLYHKQWYLHHGAKDNNDMNVIPAWEQGYSGKDVVVTILDDGIQTDHPDLVDNYDPRASFDINDDDPDPMPRNDFNNKHGTRCAGEVASMAFNDYCGVGIAYNAKIGGVRMLDGSVTDAVEARALSHNPQHIDIYSASWGPEDNGATVDGPGKLAKMSFMNGISKGRQGKGSIYVWASGNGGRQSDNCNCDGYTNSIFTLSISSATQRNDKPWYLEQCSSTLATTYSSGRPSLDPNVVTVDMDRTFLQDRSNGKPGNPRKLCTERHTGTSASAPMAAGICALALEANPNLTWRDMQHLVVTTSRYMPLETDGSWITNGVKRKVSHKFGYGLMDGEQMVNAAKTWKTVPPQRKCDSPEDSKVKTIPQHYHGMIQTAIYSDGCKGTHSEVRYLEHVQATITLNFKPRGNLLIKLVSPMGTHSTLLFPRPHDMNDESFNNWPFLSVHFWGENPAGNWTLSVLNAGVSMPNRPGVLRKWSLSLYGTYENPQDQSSDRVPPEVNPPVYHGECDEQCQFGCYGSGPDQCYSCKHYQMELTPKLCVKSCPKGYFAENGVCKICHESCKSCFGPHANDCQSCKYQHYLKVDEMACVSDCPSGFFKNKEQKTCVRCEVQCKSCSKFPHHCDECADNLVMVNGNKCDSSCPSVSYHNIGSNRCEQCSSACKQCYGPAPNQCLACHGGLYLNNGSCVDRCQNSTALDTQTSICYKCNPLCTSCSDDATCESCVPGFTIGKAKCVPKDNCIQDGCECPNECSACSQSPLKCTKCKSAYYLQDGKCVDKCSPGFYENPDGICWPCFEQCQHCSGPKMDQCTSCYRGSVLHHGSCLPACPLGFYKARGGICERCNSTCKTCISEYDCISCPENHFYLAQKCVPECPIGYHSSDTQQCIKCHHSCATCNGDGPFSCLSCNNGMLSDNGKCVPCSYNQFFDINKRECVKCDSSCKTCYGASELNCNSCLPPLQFDALDHRCVRCCPQNKPVTFSCCYCDQFSGVCSRTVHGYIKSQASDGSTKERDPIAIFTGLKWLSVAICIFAVFLFFAIFGIFQYCSSRDPTHLYEPVPVRSDNGVDKITLTSEDLEDDEDFVHS